MLATTSLTPLKISSVYASVLHVYVICLVCSCCSARINERARKICFHNNNIRYTDTHSASEQGPTALQGTSLNFMTLN